MENSIGLEIEPTLALELSPLLSPLLKKRQMIKQAIALLDTELEQINDGISGAMVRNDVAKIEIDGFSVTYNPAAERSSLDKTTLVELGVSTDVIKQATNTSTFAKLDVREKKQKS